MLSEVETNYALNTAECGYWNKQKKQNLSVIGQETPPWTKRGRNIRNELL